MDLHSDNLFWPQKNGVLGMFGPLTTDETCEVVVLGGGITGALVAEAFTASGIDTVVVDKQQIAHGSTSASTALLQYEIDEPLFSLQEKIGYQAAQTAYHLCADSIAYLHDLATRVAPEADFQDRPSLYFANDSQDSDFLQKEFLARQAAGFEVQWLNQAELFERYGLNAYAAIRSQVSAQVDPYRFTYALFSEVQKRGGRVFESTDIQTIQTDGWVVLTSVEGHTIRAKKIIFAVGYEAKNFLTEKTASLKSTYACVTRPLDPNVLWAEKCLLWNTANPYFYARVTSDNRILIGGEDIEFQNDKLRDALIPLKRAALTHTFEQFFPQIPIEVEYAWAGTFGETKDALPYIGESPEWKNAYFALGYGGNGITFSAVAAQALRDIFLGKKYPGLEIFRFGR